MKNEQKNEKITKSFSTNISHQDVMELALRMELSRYSNRKLKRIIKKFKKLGDNADDIIKSVMKKSYPPIIRKAFGFTDEETYDIVKEVLEEKDSDFQILMLTAEIAENILNQRDK